MNKTFIEKIFPFVLLFLFLHLSLPAQRAAGTAMLEGSVTDEEGEPIVGALVTIKSFDVHGRTIQGFEKTSKTNNKGLYRLMHLGSGECHIRASADGYLSQTHRISISQVYSNPRINFKLKKAPLVEKQVKTSGFDEEGHALFEQGKYEQAIALYKLHMKENPEAFETSYFIGNCYLQMGKIDYAVMEYTKVIEGTRKEDIPESKQLQALAATALGNIYLDRESRDVALKYYIKSLEFNPQNTALAYTAGEMLFAAGKTEEALEYYGKAAGIDPGWSEAYLKWGYAALKLEKTAEAKEHFLKFLELSPDHPQAEEVKNILKDLEK
ncbi:MAG: tetratricopeptide repeat protein [Candidatus Aminicenantes bacterium]|nr:tetratricopeptide repeat protein [Candidatus Aminicenantes bacterium]